MNFHFNTASYGIYKIDLTKLTIVSWFLDLNINYIEEFFFYKKPMDGL